MPDTRSEAAAYEIVPYRPALKPEIARLQRQLWAGDEAANAAYFEWKYERNPYVSAPMVHVVLHEGRAVGMRGLYGACWEVGVPTERRLVPCADDFLIDAGHRNRGLFARIMAALLGEAAARGLPHALSLAGSATTLAGSLAGGWRSLGSAREVHRAPAVPAWRRGLGARMRGSPYAWRWAAAVGEPDALPGRRPFHRLDRGLRGAPGTHAVALDTVPRPAAMADLVRRLGHDGRIRHVRDAEYLAWRYASPRHEYRFLFAGSEPLQGYLALQAVRHDERRPVAIVDWEAETPAIRQALLRAALERGRFADLRAWTVSLPDDARALLAAAGFVPADHGPLVREGPHLLVHPLGAGAADARLLDRAAWDMRMLYSMAG
jgi:hypothetical protein